MQKGGEKGGGSSPSINLQAGAGVTHARERLEVKGMCRCWLCVGSGVPGACVCLPGPRVTYSSGFSPYGVSGWGLRPDGPTGQRGREANAPWSLLWKTGEACSACPSSCLWLALSIGPPSLPCPEAQWDPRRAGAAARALGFPGGGQEVSLDSCSSKDPVGCAELSGRVGTSHRETERVRAGRTAR